MSGLNGYEFGKRVLDLAGAGVGLLVSSPLLVLIMWRARSKLGRPSLFRHERAGRHGLPFDVLKIRTMTDERDEAGALLPDADRLTPFGQTLRSASIDELPQLWNVLRGEMSLVGPRPLPMRYVNRYSVHQRRRLDVKPGLTGWAQIQGRNLTSWPDRLEQDVWYVDNRSFVLDLKILWRTIGVVLARRGVSAEGQATMEEFFGEGEGAG
ncbi:MAG: sugar transferase [Bacteroidota bacterium]